MNNKSKPQACSVFGIRGAKVSVFGGKSSNFATVFRSIYDVIYFCPVCKDLI